MTWNASSSLSKYKELSPAFKNLIKGGNMKKHTINNSVYELIEDYKDGFDLELVKKNY